MDINPQLILRNLLILQYARFAVFGGFALHWDKIGTKPTARVAEFCKNFSVQKARPLLGDLLCRPRGAGVETSVQPIGNNPEALFRNIVFAAT